MIPKIIHYCWFGRKPLPPLALKCIASWKKYLPDYEIKEWNEDNFDVNAVPYTEQAYAQKKYAFVSDYARFKIMYEYGGVYFDTDVEVVKPLDDIIDKGNFFGLENNDENPDFTCAPGLGFACIPGLELCKDMVDLYKNLAFCVDGRNNIKTVVQYFSELLLEKGLEPHKGIIEFQDVTIYPSDYFCPKSFENGKIVMTENTRTIHHYAASWLGPKEKFIQLLTRLIGTKNVLLLWKMFMKHR
jgi:hypothetical protein